MMCKYVVFFWSFGLLALLYGCEKKPLEETICISNAKGEVSYLKDTYRAGDKIKFKLSTENILNEDILIVWDGKFGQQYFEKNVLSEDFFFIFPDSISTISGFVKIKIIHCDKVFCQADTYIKSLHSVGTIESYLGPKTLAIDQNMKSMLCLIPTDKYGNALEKTDSVAFNIKYRNMNIQHSVKGIENLLSYQKILNNKQVGKVLMGAKCYDTYIDEQEIAIVEGPMQSVKINIVEMHPYGDKRQLVHLNTDIIYDAKGNVVADGTSIIFVIKEKGIISSQYQAYTVSGIANVFLENPENAVNWKVSIAGTTKSNELDLIFKDNIESVPLRVEKNYLVVGPVIGSLDQYVPDGTKVEVTFNLRTSKHTVIEHGFARIQIPQHAIDAVETICEVKISGKIVKLIF